MKIGDLVLRLYNPVWAALRDWNIPGVVISIDRLELCVEVLHDSEVLWFGTSELEVVDESR